MRLRPLAFAALLASCHGEPPEPPPPLPKVRVAPAIAGPLDEVVTLTGVLAALPGRDVKLGALVPGRLARMTVAEGDAVKAGEVLAEIEGGPAGDELAQAQASVEEAQAAKSAADEKLRRTEELRRRGIAAAQEEEQARAEAAAAKSALDRARAAVDIATRKVSRTALRAPFDGVVAAVYARAGESVDGSGQPVVEVAAPDPVELRAAASPREAARLRPGQPARIHVDGAPVERDGEVYAVSPLADPASGNVLVRVRAKNADGALKLGLVARAAVAVRHLEDAVSVPEPALLSGPDGCAAVVVVEQGKAKQVPVSVVAESGGRAAVSGLAAGASVVVEGGYALPDGTSVEVEK